MWVEEIPEEKQDLFFPEISRSFAVFLRMRARGGGQEIWCVASCYEMTILRGVNNDWKSISPCLTC